MLNNSLSSILYLITLTRLRDQCASQTYAEDKSKLDLEKPPLSVDMKRASASE